MPREQQRGGHGHRAGRLAEQIREEVSQIVGYEMRDERVGFATVTDVQLGPDLATARVFVSILGDETEKKRGVDALNRASAFIRRQLAPRLRTRKTPNVVFVLDELLEQGNRIEDLLKKETPAGE
jgi:ribosome-binding factor A